MEEQHREKTMDLSKTEKVVSLIAYRRARADSQPPKVTYRDGWYHEAAIEDAAKTLVEI